jgi:hypothetical protein
MNLGTSIAVYAAVQRELNERFDFPGPEGAWNARVDITDLDLLSRFTLTAIFEERARHNESFNVVNGEMFRWSDMWPVLGEYFGFSKDNIGINTRDIEKEMSSKEDIWNQIVQKYNLEKNDLKQIGTWWFVKSELGRTWDVHSSMSKSRYFFTEIKNSKETFLELFQNLEKSNIIPSRSSFAT